MIKNNGISGKTYKVLICFLSVLLLFGLVLPSHGVAETTNNTHENSDALTEDNTEIEIMDEGIETTKSLDDRVSAEEISKNAVVAPMASPGTYDVADTNLILEVKGSSTNNHTQALMAWYDQDGNFYVAVQSTHELKEIMEIYSATETYTSFEAHYYGAGADKKTGVMYHPITVGGITYNKVHDSVNGNTDDTRWTVYKFQGKHANITAGEYTFSILGIGGGHDVKGQRLTISVPKIDISVKKVWKKGQDPRPPVKLQLYIGEEAVRGTSVTLVHPSTNHTWKDMEATDGRGVRLNYTVKEEPIPDYITSTSGNAAEGFTVTNTYDPRVDVTIKKIVSGNFGDRLREFSFTVAINEEQPKPFVLKHGAEHELKDLRPDDVITLYEDASGYDVIVTLSGKEEPVEPDQYGIYNISVNEITGDKTITVINHKDVIIDTGVLLDSLPYLIILAVVIAGIALILLRKHRISSED